MSELGEVLTQVRHRIARYRHQNIGEQNTKSSLIDPVLRALGWNIEDFEEVHREYRPKPADNPVDYALFILRTPRLFVEAKTLGGNLDDRKWANQIMGYAAVSGVSWVVLTDGDEYRLYNAHAPVPIEEKLFRTVRVSDDGSTVADTLNLLSKAQMQENLIDSLWKSAFLDNQVRAVLDGIFGPEPDPAFVRLVRSRLPHLSPSEVKSSLMRLRVRFDFPTVSPSPSLPDDGQISAPAHPPSDTFLWTFRRLTRGATLPDRSLLREKSAGAVRSTAHFRLREVTLVPRSLELRQGENTLRQTAGHSGSSWIRMAS